jgi:hypothetical protein
MAQSAFADSFFAFVVKIPVGIRPGNFTVPPVIVFASEPFPDS